MATRTILDSLLHKLPSTRKYYRVSLIVPDNGIPFIEYHQANSSKKPKKCINFADLLFADKKHDMNEKFAFSVYTTDKTITFLAKDETVINEWLSKIRECHSNLYPEFKRYDAIFEANLLDKGLAKTMSIHGQYRLALGKDSLDLIPLLTTPLLLSDLQQQQQEQPSSTTTTTTSSSSTSSKNNLITNHLLHHRHHHHQKHKHHIDESILSKHHPPPINPLNSNTSITPHANHLPQHLPSHQRFHKRFPLLSSKTIELVFKSIRRCGHTDCNFFIESGRQSQIGEGDLWMTLSKKSTARQLHELLLATMKTASNLEDQFYYKTPRSRSGSSSENAHRSQHSRSSSMNCLVPNPPTGIASSSSAATAAAAAAAAVVVSTTTNNINCNSFLSNRFQAANTSTMSTIPMLSNNGDVDEDSGYLPMA